MQSSVILAINKFNTELSLVSPMKMVKRKRRLCSILVNIHKMFHGLMC